MSQNAITLSGDEQTTLRTAAYGAVTLLSMTRPDTKAPAETAEFQRAVTTAIQQAIATTSRPSQAQNDMAAKITAALQGH